MANATFDQKPVFTIRLLEVRAGAQQDDLTRILRRMYPRRTKEELQGALRRLPLVLSRSASGDLVRKVKRALEPHGAVLQVTRNPSSDAPGVVRPSSPPVEPITSGISETEARRAASTKQPGGGRLVPMGVAELLDRSFRLLRQRFWLFFLILLIPQAASYLVSKASGYFAWGSSWQGIPVAMGIGLGISVLLAVLVFLTLQIWAQGALIHGVSEVHLDNDTTVTACYGAIRHRLGRLLFTLFLMWLFLGLVIGGACLAIPMVISLMVLASSGKWAIGLAVTLIGLIAAYLFLRLLLNWLMADKVVVLEGKKGLTALRRSRELMTARTEPGFWQAPKLKAALILLMGLLIGIGIHLVFQIPAVLLQLLMPGVVAFTFTSVLDVAASALATTYAAIALVLYYYDIRIRKEGFDLKMLAQEL
jgi:hypothetical protein